MSTETVTFKRRDGSLVTIKKRSRIAKFHVLVENTPHVEFAGDADVIPVAGDFILDASSSTAPARYRELSMSTGQPNWKAKETFSSFGCFVAAKAEAIQGGTDRRLLVRYSSVDEMIRAAASHSQAVYTNKY